MAEEQGIDLIYIWEDQWLHKQSIVKDIIRARLGIYEKEYMLEIVLLNK